MYVKLFVCWFDMSSMLVLSKRVPWHTVVSRKVVSVSLISYVNLIVACASFALSIQCLNWCFVQFTMTKMSSMYRSR